MGKIKVLPDSLANKIAAGEVVERPASVVKELLENSLDAGARKIHIEIESGGKRLIRIQDDGEGMTRDDAITAFERHATSKLRTAEDLEAISTLGFRGEALPSIASVSRLFLRTKSAKDIEGTEVEFNGGKLIAVRDIGWPGGAEFEIKDLFFNIPARRKFLKSDATESFHITSLVQHYALANPAVTFLLINNGRDAIRVAPARTLKERAYQLLGGSLLEKLLKVECERDGLRVIGYVSNPQEQRSSKDAQYLFINGRYVKDQVIGRALKEAYRSMMPSGTYPAAILFIDVPPSEVDVNVHPAKTEVRFLHEAAILSFTRQAVADALTTTQPTTRLPGTPAREAKGFVAGGFVDRSPQNSRPNFSPPSSARFPLPGSEAQSPAKSYREILNAGETVDPGSERDETQTGRLAAALSSYPDQLQENEIQQGGQPFEEAQKIESGVAEPEAGWGAAVGEVEIEELPLPGLGHGIKPMGQIRDSYIAATDEEGLLLIDQHAAHERVLFEQFRDLKLSRSGGVQPLLIPETLDLTSAEIEAFEIVQPELETMGVETMRLSGRAIAVKTAPSGIPTSDVIALVREVVCVVERERRNFSLEDIRDSIAASLACKAAIKVNMRLTDEKMQWLIDELMKTKNPMTCPHGRPSIMRFGLREIERGFKRPV